MALRRVQCDGGEFSEIAISRDNDHERLPLPAVVVPRLTLFSIASAYGLTIDIDKIKVMRVAGRPLTLSTILVAVCPRVMCAFPVRSPTASHFPQPFGWS